MSNPLPNRWQRGSIVDKNGQPTPEFARYLRDLEQKTGPTLNINGQVQSTAKLSGRTEQLSVTLQNITSVGKLSSADAVAADGVTFARVNASAITANNVDLAKPGVVNKTAANIAETSNLKWRQTAHSTTQPTGLTITGTDTGAGTASAAFSAFTQQVPGLTSYPINATLFINLANATTYYCYVNDPNLNGVGVSVSLSTNPNDIFGAIGNSYVGTLVTPAGGAGPTTGKPGGTGGARNIGTVLS